MHRIPQKAVLAGLVAATLVPVAAQARETRMIMATCNATARTSATCTATTAAVTSVRSGRTAATRTERGRNIAETFVTLVATGVAMIGVSIAARNALSIAALVGILTSGIRHFVPAFGSAWAITRRAIFLTITLVAACRGPAGTSAGASL